jgi:hypothetical protein
MSTSDVKHLKMLKRRADHLAGRIEDNPNLSYDQAELSALRWAVRELEKKHERSND